MRILYNHIGYDPDSVKNIVLLLKKDTPSFSVELVDEEGKLVESTKTVPIGPVENWGQGSWFFHTADFSHVKKTGRFRLRIRDGEWYQTDSFLMAPGILQRSTISDLLYYFKGQRTSGIYDRQDRAIPFVGKRTDTVDVHGGWYDASGDLSKYLSHLSYANFMNPQQTPLVVWSLLESADLLKSSKDERLPHQVWRMEEEAAHGADYLVRSLDPTGAFYATVFDRWSKDITQREICAYRTQAGEKLDTWQAAYRQGGGMAIAALARSAASSLQGDEFAAADYARAARKAFAHLEAENIKYLPDGKENIIDDYCALLAATELYAMSKEETFLAAARYRCERLVARLSEQGANKGWWAADDNKSRPFFHASDAGLPVIALLRYCEVETDAVKSRSALLAVQKAVAFELALTKAVANPFGYARQFVKAIDSEAFPAFFFPHKNESGYWWQGENARLASVAAASFALAQRNGADYPTPESIMVDGKHPPFIKISRSDLVEHGLHQLNWIFGSNPFDACMMHGKGRNTPDYLPGWPNAPGGVCNGITSGFDDERDIALLPQPQASDPFHNWRWGEQWIPHAAWLLLALSRFEKLQSSGT